MIKFDGEREHEQFLLLSLQAVDQQGLKGRTDRKKCVRASDREGQIQKKQRKLGENRWSRDSEREYEYV